MPVKWLKNQVRVWKLKKIDFNWRQKVCNDDDETTASGRPLETWAAATRKARLPTVESFMGGVTRQLVLADCSPTGHVSNGNKGSQGSRGLVVRVLDSW